jgi:tRNA pseudouridine38-40 synthase
MKSPFNIVALWCWYHGQQFHGYQQQQELRTVQAELLKAFSRAGLSRNPVVAGRTDKGVSARMQVLSCRMSSDADAQQICERLNALLPHDIGIHAIVPAPLKFHAAWRSNAKEYRYQLLPSDVGDLSLLREALALIPGTRDFKVFHFKSSEVRTRTVHSVELFQCDNGFELRFGGEGFARYMVRMLVAGALMVSLKQISIDVFRRGLLDKENFYCPTAPADPLTLWNVGYPAEWDPFSDEQRRAFKWPATKQGLPGC